MVKGKGDKGGWGYLFIPSLINRGVFRSLSQHLLFLRHKFNDSEDVLGFSSYDNFLKVTTAVCTVYTYQLIQKNSDDLEKKIGSMPVAVQGIASKQLKPLKEEINKYKNLVPLETIKAVDAHGDELRGIFAPLSKIKLMPGYVDTDYIQDRDKILARIKDIILRIK